MRHEISEALQDRANRKSCAMVLGAHDGARYEAAMAGPRAATQGRAGPPSLAPARPDPLSKTLLDRGAALLALVMLAPLFLMVAALIYLRDPGPVFFAHRRIGKGGRSFRCLKFRTMAMDGDAILERHLACNDTAASEWRETRKLKDDPRVTPLGDVLRRSSLDELPQLINILRGDMSIVGPRPIVEDEVRFYGAAMADYLSVRPGLTGLWQISGRNDVGYGQRVRLDQEYVRGQSFGGDLGIILRTVRVVLQQKGSY